MLLLKFKVVHREIGGELFPFAVLAVGHHHHDPSLVTLHLVGESGRRAEWTVREEVYAALPVFTFCEFDEEPGEDLTHSERAAC